MSNALDRPRKTLMVYSSLSKAFNTWSVKEARAASVDRPDLNPYCEFVSKFWSLMKVINWLYTTRSNSLLIGINTDTGRKFGQRSVGPVL